MDPGIDGYQFQPAVAVVPFACFRQPEAVSATVPCRPRDIPGKAGHPHPKSAGAGHGEKVFEDCEPEDTAARVVDAFSDYWLPLGFAEREPDQVMANAEALLKIILRGIAVRG